MNFKRSFGAQDAGNHYTDQRLIRATEFPIFYPPHVEEICDSAFSERIEPFEFHDSNDDLSFSQKMLIQSLAGIILTVAVAYIVTVSIGLISIATRSVMNFPENNPLSLTHLFLLYATLVGVRRYFTDSESKTNLTIRVRRNLEVATFLFPAFIASAGITFELYRIQGELLLCKLQGLRFGAKNGHCLKDVVDEELLWGILSPSLLLYTCLLYTSPSPRD